MRTFLNERPDVDSRLFEKDRFTFSVLAMILDGPCKKTITDDRTFILCQSAEPYPIWVWTADSISEEGLAEAFRITLAEWPKEGIPNASALYQPVRVRELLNAVETLSERVHRLQKQFRQRPKIRSVEEQHIIDQAKKILMKHSHMTEPQAHRHLQTLSMNSGAGLIETARKICKNPENL